MKKGPRRRKNKPLANQQSESQPKNNPWIPVIVISGLLTFAFLMTYAISLAIKSDEKKASERKEAFMAKIQSGNCETLFQESLEAAANSWWQSSAAKGVLYQNCRDRNRQK